MGLASLHLLLSTQEGWGLPPRGNCPQDHRIHYLEKNKQK